MPKFKSGDKVVLNCPPEWYNCLAIVLEFDTQIKLYRIVMDRNIDAPIYSSPQYLRTAFEPNDILKEIL